MKNETNLAKKENQSHKNFGKTTLIEQWNKIFKDNNPYLLCNIFVGTICISFFLNVNFALFVDFKSLVEDGEKKKNLCVLTRK